MKKALQRAFCLLMASTQLETHSEGAVLDLNICADCASRRIRRLLSNSMLRLSSTLSTLITGRTRYR